MNENKSKTRNNLPSIPFWHRFISGHISQIMRRVESHIYIESDIWISASLSAREEPRNFEWDDTNLETWLFLGEKNLDIHISNKEKHIVLNFCHVSFRKACLRKLNQIPVRFFSKRNIIIIQQFLITRLQIKFQTKD